jgi:hypothetical protein
VFHKTFLFKLLNIMTLVMRFPYFVTRRQKQLFRSSAMTTSGNDVKWPTDEDRTVPDEYVIAFGAGLAKASNCPVSLAARSAVSPMAWMYFCDVPPRD